MTYYPVFGLFCRIGHLTKWCHSPLLGSVILSGKVQLNSIKTYKKLNYGALKIIIENKNVTMRLTQENIICTNGSAYRRWNSSI